MKRRLLLLAALLATAPAHAARGKIGAAKVVSRVAISGWCLIRVWACLPRTSSPMKIAHILLKGALFCVLPILGADAHAQAASSQVTAIDILLEPDATMLRHAEASNARLLKTYPKGFSLDAAHRPHVTMIQCFVRTADLDKVYAAAHKVLSAANVNAMKLEAFKYYYAPAGATGVAGICAKPTPKILKLQADIIAATKPFTVETGTISAFTSPHDEPALDAMLIGYVSTFVPKMSGEYFNPHVSTGTAPNAYLDQMLKESFEPFAFSPAGAAVYQLGPFGTAAKKLKEWNLKQ